jgi:hypothetical protein
MLLLKQNILTLKGITLRGSIELFNPNENLAVIFEICKEDREFRTSANLRFMYGTKKRYYYAAIN